MYKLKLKKEIPTFITETGTEEKVSREALLVKFKSELLVFYKGITFQDKVPVVKMYPEAWEVVK